MSIKPDGTDEKLLVDLSEDSEDYIYFSRQEIYPYRYKMLFSPENELYFSAGAGKGIFHREGVQSRKKNICHINHPTGFPSRQAVHRTG